PSRPHACPSRQGGDPAEHGGADGDCAEDERTSLAASRLSSEGEVTAQEVSRAVNRWDYHCIPARDGRDICDAGNDSCAHGAGGRFVPLTAPVDGPHEWHSAQRPAESLPTIVGAFRFCCERVEPLARPRLNAPVQPAEQVSCQDIGETSEEPVHLHYRLPGTEARRRVILDGAASASVVRAAFAPAPVRR